MDEKLRRLKDEAAAWMLKGKPDKALSLYHHIATENPDDIASLMKCGDLSRKLGHNADAIAYYTRVSMLYAADGLLLKAIAACKLILEIEKTHTATQTMLAELYAKKLGRAANPTDEKTLPTSATKPPVSPVALLNDLMRKKPDLKKRLAKRESGHDGSGIPLSAMTAGINQLTRDKSTTLGETPQAPSSIPLSTTDTALELESTAGAKMVLAGEEIANPTSSAPIVIATPPPLTERTVPPASREGEGASVLRPDLGMLSDITVPSELPSIPLFSELPKNAFIHLTEQMTMRQVVPDEVVIQEGEVDDAMYIISSGRMKVTKVSEAGSEVTVARLKEGAFFGEMALLGDAPRTASVIAEEESLLFAISRKVLDSMVSDFPSVKHILTRFYRQRLLANLMMTSPIFKPLSPDQRKSLIEKFKSREVPPQEKLLEEGAPGDGLYLLLSGLAEVSMVSEGKRKVLAHLKEGDVFGEMSLLNNTNCIATVKTLRKSLVLKLPRRTFLEIASTHPQLLAHISDLSEERQMTTDAILQGKLAFSEQGLVVI